MPMNAEKDVEGGAGTAVPPHRNGNRTGIRGKGPKEDKQGGGTPARNGAGSALQVAGTLKGLAKRAREEGKDAHSPAGRRPLLSSNSTQQVSAYENSVCEVLKQRLRGETGSKQCADSLMHAARRTCAWPVS